MIRPKAWQTLIAVALLSLSGCVADFPYIGTDGPDGSAAETANPNAVDLALADLIRGDFVDAEAQIAVALIATPDDPYAIFAAAVLYQNTERYPEARAMYQRLLAMDPKQIANARAVVRDWSGLKSRPLNEVARVNLQKLDDEQLFGNWLNRSAPGAQAPVASPAKSQSPWATSAPTTEHAAQANRVRRFTLLARLRDKGFISTEEYGSRRTANLGALLPLSAKRPAAGMDQSFPSDDKIVARLVNLRKQLQSGQIGRAGFIEHRSRLLDGLLPVVPAIIAPAAAPPQGLMASAERVRALEALKNAGLISSTEMILERTAIEDHLRQSKL